jgi:hypothetical protein
MKTLRFKTSFGITASWRVGKGREGRFKVLGLSNAKVGRNPLPLDFVPFEMSNVVFNGPSFETEDEVIRFVRTI